MPDLEPYDSPDENPETRRFRQYDAISIYLRNASQRQPLLIVLEDLHWADEGSLRFLVHFMRNLRPCRILVLGTYRNAELQRKHPLAKVLGEFMRERLFERHAVGGLSEADVIRYIRSAATEFLEQDLGRRIYDLTDGNPLYVTQLVRYLKEHRAEGKDGSTQEEWLVRRWPEGLREVVGNRLDRLSEHCNEVLEVACLLGADFGITELSLVLEWPPQELMKVLDEATYTGIIETETGEVGRYQFAHAVISETLQMRLPLGQRTQTHARIGQVLEQEYGDQAEAHAGELAMHFEAALGILGPEKYAGYAHVAGQQAITAGAFEDALRLLVPSAKALEHTQMGDLRGELLYTQVQALASIGRVREAADCLEEAFTLFERIGSHRRAAAVAAEVGRHFFQPVSRDWWVMNSRRGFYEQALRLVSPSSGEAARILANWGFCVGAHENDDDRARELLGKAMKIAEELGDFSHLAYVEHTWGRLDYEAIRFDEYATRSFRVLKLARQLKDSRSEVKALLVLVHALPLVGRIPEASEHAKTMLSVAERLGDRTLLLGARERAAAVALFQGDFDGAREMLDLVPADVPETEAIRALYWRVKIECETGQFDKGRICLHQLLELTRELVGGPNAASMFVPLAILSAACITWDTDHLDLVRKLANATLANADAGERNMTSARSYLGQVAWITNDVQLAREQYEGLRGRTWAVDHAVLPRVYGVLARMIGNHDEAVNHFRTALGMRGLVLLQDIHIRHELAETLYLRNRGEDRREARGIWRQALDESERLGLAPLGDRIEAGLARFADGHDSPYPDGLSPREIDVLRLLAGGKANKAIANELFISPKTVENHVARIFAKIGVGNRTEAGQYAYRRGLT